jgi:battenin
MLPMPPGASIGRYKARLAALFAGAEPRVCLAFWLFGILYSLHVKVSSSKTNFGVQ